RRTMQEVLSILRCLSAPVVYFVDYTSHCIFLEDIVGYITVRDHIASTQLSSTQKIPEDRLEQLAKKMDRILAKMRDEDVVHGDLTTSNITHPNTEVLFEKLLKAYAASSKKPHAVVNKLDKVRVSGRKRLTVC
uniref:non-specific serine/threonine protein kinase n=1 Tax=Oncorhynchus tshawytscha TaxID=74940 RepID=A0A8C8JWV7_ONCTS